MVQRLIWTMGLPASGKTTWAKDIQKSDPTFKLVNKDDLRAMIDDTPFTQEKEDVIRSLHKDIIISLLVQGHNVIVHDTHFSPVYPKYYEEIVLSVLDILDDQGTIGDITIECRDEFLAVPRAECIKRDVNRESSVGSHVIESMWNKYVERMAKEPKVS